MSWLLKNYYQATVAVLVGFMTGSLWKIWPWKACTLEGIDRHGEAICLYEANLLPEASSQLVLVIVLLVAGFLIVSLLDHLQSGSNPLFSRFWRPGGAEATTQ